MLRALARLILKDELEALRSGADSWRKDTLRAEQAKAVAESNAEYWHELYDGVSERYRKAVDSLLAATEARQAAEAKLEELKQAAQDIRRKVLQPEYPLLTAQEVARDIKDLINYE